jgi:hypothetical protein
MPLPAWSRSSTILPTAPTADATSAGGVPARARINAT